MNIDVVDLNEFYRSALSNNAQNIIKKLLLRLRKADKNKRTLFVGFGTPYAEQTQNEFLLMQAHFGAIAWPSSKENRVLLAYESEWAFTNHIFDEIIIIHGLEYARHAGELLKECYRCLCPEGRIIIIAPNRRGVWVRSDKTPFGFGEPYSLTQLSLLLKKCDFIPVDAMRGLYTLPTSTRIGNLWAWIFERIAPCALQKFSGLVGVAAVKRVYGGIPAKKFEKEQRVAVPC